MEGIMMWVWTALPFLMMLPNCRGPLIFCNSTVNLLATICWDLTALYPKKTPPAILPCPNKKSTYYSQIDRQILPNGKWNSNTFLPTPISIILALQPRMSLRTSTHTHSQHNNAHFSLWWDKQCLIFSMVWYLNKRANFYFFSLCARSLYSLALLTPRHSWMTHSRMNQPSQIQPELFLACPLRSFGVCLHSPRMLKHQRCCGSWDWHGQSKLEGWVEEGGKKG